MPSIQELWVRKAIRSKTSICDRKKILSLKEGNSLFYTATERAVLILKRELIIKKRVPVEVVHSWNTRRCKTLLKQAKENRPNSTRTKSKLTHTVTLKSVVGCSTYFQAQAAEKHRNWFNSSYNCKIYWQRRKYCVCVTVNTDLSIRRPLSGEG